MFATDFNFMLEFYLPEEIFGNQDLIRLQVHHVDTPIVEIPLCPIGHKSTSERFSGEIHCIERYKYIKDVLPFINRWVNSIYCACSRLHGSRSNHFAEAKLYAYKNDKSLFKKWNLVEFHPLFNPDTTYTNDGIELIFRFENVIEENK